jgi:hypothetical protein
LLYRFKTWALACGRRDLVNNLYANPENYRLCAAHFDNEMFTNSQKSRLRLDATPKKPLGDTLSTFSQTEVTVQPPGEKPSTVTSAIFAEEVRAIPSTSKQIYLEIPASSSGVSHPSYCKRILKTQQENYLFHPKHVAHKLCSERSLTRG